jgi:hypothetical protein
VSLLVLWRHRKFNVLSHPMKAPCVSVVDFGLLHVDPPVLTSGALRDWRLRLSLRERLWDAGTSVVATSQLVDGD